jgi:hypothetical protein
MAKNQSASKTSEQIAVEFLSTQEGKEKQRLLRTDAVACMLEQTLMNPKVTLTVKRSENVVTIEWEFNRLCAQPSDYLVSARLAVMELNPDPEKLQMLNFDYPRRGNGKIGLALEEGTVYHGFFLFIKEDMSDDITMHFVVAIPLSPELKLLIGKATGREKNPTQWLRDNLSEFVEKQDVFEESSRSIIYRIKSRKLPPEVEQQRIADFKDYAAMLKEQCEM